MKNNPTTLQIFDFIVRYIDENGYPPTQREISDAVYLSRSTVPRHLDALAKRGLIRYDEGKFRGIVVLRRPVEKS